MTPFRRHRSRRKSCRDGGMTLIEVLVALALLSFLSAGLITSFSLGQRSYRQILNLDRSYWDVVVAQRFLRGALESVYPFEPASASSRGLSGLESSSNQLSFTAPAVLADVARGYRRYTLSVERRSDGLKDLMLTSALDRNGESVGVGGPSGRAELLVTRAIDIEWAFREDTESDVWRTTWGERRPPALIRVRVEFPRGDSRSWPEMLVAPRVTDDANCEFDVVAQACRESAS
ncbi:MAG: type II secretion system protein [Gammaproteobacteria bacterium]